MPFIAMALALCLTIGGGVSVALESAQQGDMLYPYKTNVNHEVHAAISAVIGGEAEATDNLYATSTAQVGVHANADATIF